MPNASWVQLANNEQYSQINAGVALSNSSSLTDISPGTSTVGQAYSVAANSLYAGQQIRLTARGVFSTTGTPNITVGVYLGGVANTALATSTFAASANTTNAIWSLTADVRCDQTGTAGSLRTLGAVYGLGSSPVMLPQTSGSGSVVSVATGSTAILTVGAQWGTGSPSNSIQVLEYLVEQLN